MSHQARQYADGSDPSRDKRHGWDALLTMRSGLKTAMEQMPTPAFAVPYAAPKDVKMMALAHPIAPKNGCHDELACGDGYIPSKSLSHCTAACYISTRVESATIAIA